MPQRSVSVARSSAPSGAAAGEELAAAVRAMDDLQLAFLLVNDALDVEALVAVLHHALDGVPLIGGTTAGGTLLGDDPTAPSTALVVGFAGAGFRATTGVSSCVDGRLRDAAAEAAGCLADLGESAHRVVLVLSDGLAGDQREVVRGAYAVAGAAVPLVGGCTGDAESLGRARQIHGNQVLRGAVVAAAIGSDGPFGIGVEHGWRPVGAPMLVTASDGATLLSLDERPALDVYLERLGAPPEAGVDRGAFLAFAPTHPLGITRPEGTEVRYVADADFESRELRCIANVPQGSIVQSMVGDTDSVLAATDAACQRALEGLDGAPLALLAFDCIARRGVLADESGEEGCRLASHAGDAPVAGFDTFGEIARVRGTNGFHNQTLVVLAVG